MVLMVYRRMPSVQAKWEEMFGRKEDAVVEEKVKKPAKKRVPRKTSEEKSVNKGKKKDSAKSKNGL